MSSQGAYALKLTTEPAFEPQFEPMVGAYYTFDIPVSSQSAVFSADIYLSEQGSTSFRNIMALVDLQENRYRTYLDFLFNGNINVFVKGGLTGILWYFTGKTWVAET